MPDRWTHLVKVAQEEVDDVLASLPEALQEATKDVSVFYDHRVADPDDHLDEGTLGHFVGRSYADVADAPAEVILYLNNLWSYAGYDEEAYREEVRTTLLHELGHYLGWGESDLEDRGL